MNVTNGRTDGCYTQHRAAKTRTTNSLSMTRTRTGFHVCLKEFLRTKNTGWRLVCSKLVKAITGKCVYTCQIRHKSAQSDCHCLVFVVYTPVAESEQEINIISYLLTSIILSLSRISIRTLAEGSLTVVGTFKAKIIIIMCVVWEIFFSLNCELRWVDNHNKLQVVVVNNKSEPEHKSI